MEYYMFFCSVLCWLRVVVHCMLMCHRFSQFQFIYFLSTTHKTFSVVAIHHWVHNADCWLCFWKKKKSTTSSFVSCLSLFDSIPIDYYLPFIYIIQSNCNAWPYSGSVRPSDPMDCLLSQINKRIKYCVNINTHHVLRAHDNEPMSKCKWNLLKFFFFVVVRVLLFALLLWKSWFYDSSI